MSEKNTSQLPSRSFLWRLFHFLGTMELAITLLITLAIASVIGTVLQQNQPYPDYLIKFGPFWFDVFEKIGLYDVYSALWFLLILLLLVVSTSVCVIRHTPSMLKDMVNMRTHVQRKSLAAMHHSRQWQEDKSLSALETQLTQRLSKQGFRFRITPQAKQGATLISAMRGGMNRMGYILTHVAIVVICLGGLLDSNLPLKFAEWQGRVKVETESKPLREIAAESRLPVGHQAFRGSVSIPEGLASEVVYLPIRDGYLVQQLPFTIEVKEFRVEHYVTGQPKSFESDLVIHDPELEAPISQTISVNHPLIYKGYAIYQASFGDGGSELNLQAWPLYTQQSEPVDLDIKVFENRTMKWAGHQMQLEMTDFRPFNINPDPTEDDPDNVRNFGPSIGFKLRQETGEALEYQNYMLPINRDGRDYYLSGVRRSPADPFAFLYIPVDKDGGLEGFMAFLHRLQDAQLVAKVAGQMRDETLMSLQSENDQALANSLQKTLEMLVSMFVKGGFSDVQTFIEQTLPAAERDKLAPAYLAMLREMLGRIYFAGLAEDSAVSNDDLLFLQDAVDAVGSLPNYGAPVYLSLTDYTHIESTGLQIARSPGKNIVYLGCALLIAGIFLLFYLPQRRLWLWLAQEGSNTTVLLAGMSNRNPRDFDLFFEQVSRALRTDEKGNSPVH